MTIGQMLKSVRLKNGWTQKQMAAGIVSTSFYSKVERGVHSIDANVLMDILVTHHIDVTEFFNHVANQPSKANINFKIENEIAFAQNQKDLKRLDKIAAKIENEEKKSIWLEIRLELAYAWILHSNEHVSTKIKNKVKSILTSGNWDRISYHYLSQAVVLLDIDDSFKLIDEAFNAFENNDDNDIFTLIFIALVAVNFLNCCYHYSAPRNYWERAIKMLYALPIDPTIGMYKILGMYYEAILNNDKSERSAILKLLKKVNFDSVVEDTIEK